jgi:hypothetical protein
MANDTVDFANAEFLYSNVSSITTNFNQNPYYDDFDDSKNYYRILFKPGYAVQARELTQIQSMLQDQIQKFGQHVFKEGSMVLGGKFYIDTRAHYAKIKDLDYFGNTVDISTFQDQIVTGQTTGIQAYVNIALDGSESTDKPKTIYITYLSGNANTGEVYFAENESLVSNVGTLVVANTTPAVGYGSVFTLSEGVRFCKQHFIHHDKQSIVIDRYDIFPTCRVGFTLEESIVDSTQDTTLLDPALESSNFANSGADRFKITPILTRLEIDDTAGFPDYVNLFEIVKGTVTEISERPVYNVIRDEIAKRTYDESGDYYVNGFNVVLEEHLDYGYNSGYLTYERGGDSSLLSVQVEPGTCYVKGYEINKLVTEFVSARKGTTFGNVDTQIISTKAGSYVNINEAVGAWNVNSGQLIYLYDTAQKRISSGISSTGPQTGNIIGTARVASVTLSDGYVGTPNGTLQLHLFDVSMNGSNSFAKVRSVYYDNTTSSDLCGDIVLKSNNAVLYDTFAPLLFYVGSDATKTIRDTDGSVVTSFYFKKTSDVSIASDGTFTLSTTSGNEFFPYGTGTMSSPDEEDIFITLNSNVSISLPGAVSTGGGTTTINGNGSTYFSRLNLGDRIELSGNTTVYTIMSIANNNTMVLNKALPSTVTGNTITKTYLAGDMIDLRGIGSSGGFARTVTTSDSSLTFTLSETFGSPVGATVSYTMARRTAREIKKVLKVNRYVSINCASNIAGSNGPFNLGFSDVYKINSIRKDTSDFTTVTQGTDVTSSFTFDNGQRDDCYKNATITPIIALTTSDKLLVCLDYFLPDYTLGQGYFSVDSYPINDVNPSTSEITTAEIPFHRSLDTGSSFNLRNYFDFRPVYTNSATDTTSLTGITTNPVSSTTLQSNAMGLRLPADSQPMSYNYSYYLPRRDIVAIDTNGSLIVIEGVSDIHPITPACPQQYMSLAKLYIAPYPSLSPTYARAIGRNDLACSTSRTSQVRFTMKDIGVLKQRVDNIENYISLSLLEKSVADLKILDANGLDRFKNGIFVDSFTSFSSSDITNPDHHICYDPKEGSIRPYFENQAIGYMRYSNTNIVQMDSMLMLPYTEVAAVKQPYATTYMNVETNVYRFIGNLYLDPDSDYWVNTQRLASQTYSFGATNADITPYSIVYGSWQTVVTGVTTSGSTLIGSTSTSSSSSVGSNIPTGTYSYQVDLRVTSPSATTTLSSLISMYGASTPITFSGISAGGTQTLSTGISLASHYSNIKTLGDLQANSAKIGQELAIVTIIITTTAGVQTTTTTTRSNTYQTTTSTGTQASRTFTETFQSIQTETHSLGDKVTSVAPIADIRPQVISFQGFGLKSSTKYYVWFDGQLMSSYVTPARTTSYPVLPKNNSFKANLIPTGIEGSSLYSDSTGSVFGFLRLPEDGTKTFRTGTKEIVITDSPTNEPDATSITKAYFAAQGINQTLQEDILTLGTVVTSNKSGSQTLPVVYSNTTNTYTTTSTSKTVTGTLGVATATLTDAVSCMAYSFKLNTPAGEEGTFLSSVDVFFAAKDPNLGVWFEIRQMDNAGNITKTQIPGSEVWLASSQVNTSADGSSATNVKFKSPIFLTNNQEYAFVIHTVGINPNYYIYTCVLGEKDILTQQYINNRPLTGTLYITNNNTDWNPVNRVDLKVTFNRAKFTTGVVGTAIIGNQSREFIQLPLTTASLSNSAWFGEKVVGNDTLTLSTPSGTIGTDDYLIGATSGVNSAVTSISGPDYVMKGTGYQSGENITVRRANGYLTTITTSVVTPTHANGNIYKAVVKNTVDTNEFNANTIVMTIDNSNGLFAPNTSIFGALSSNVTIASSITKFVYDSIQFEPSHLDFIGTTLNFSMATTSNTGVLGSYNNIIHSNIIDFDIPMAVFSKSYEISTFGGAPSNRVQITMTTNSDYLSPMVNLDRTYSVYIHNIINANTVGETNSSGGMLTNKYISQVVTLAEGQDAEDLLILTTNYLPPASNAQMKVYARISNGEDFESIYNRNWIEMVPSGIAYSSLSNRKDWKEIQYGFPTSSLIGVNDQSLPIAGYTNSANSTFQGFRQYQLKIGLLSESSAIFPRCADLRVIALQK